MPTVVFDRSEDYAETRLHCPFLWRRFDIGSTADGGKISVLGRRKESDDDLVVLTSEDDSGSNFTESSR